MTSKKITAIIAVTGIIATTVAMLLPTEAGTKTNTTETTTSVVYSSAAPAAVETATDAETTTEKTGNVSVKGTPVVYQETDKTSSSVSSVPIKTQTAVLPTEPQTQPDMSGFKNDYYISEFSQYNDCYITGAFGNKGMFGYVVITPNGAIQQYAVGFAPDWVVENCSKESNDIKINFDKYQMDTESKDIIQNVCGSVITTLKFNDDIYILSLNKSHYGLIKNGGKTTIETDSLSTLFESVYLL